MSRKLWMILALTGSVALTTACDDESDDDPQDECTPATVAEDCAAGESCVNNICVAGDECVDGAVDCSGFLCDAGECLETCIGDIDCAEGFECNTDDSTCQAVSATVFNQILVVSDTTAESVDSGKPNPGPDIDAASLTLGSEFFASTAVGMTGAFDGNPAQVTTADIPQAAIGAPNAIDTEGGDCADSFADDDSLIFSLGAGPIGTEDGDFGTGYVLLSNFQDEDGNNAPAEGFDISDTSVDCLTVYELNNMPGTPEICPNLTMVDEDYEILLLEQSVVQADFTNASGFVDEDALGDLIVAGDAVSLGSSSGISTVCAGDIQ